MVVGVAAIISALLFSIFSLSPLSLCTPCDIFCAQTTEQTEENNTRNDYIVHETIMFFRHTKAGLRNMADKAVEEKKLEVIWGHNQLIISMNIKNENNRIISEYITFLLL